MKLLKIFLLFILSSSLLFSSGNRLKKVEIVKGELRLHFSADLDTKKIHHFTLKNPYRSVYDFQNTQLGSHESFNGLGSDIRIAQNKKDAVRIVVESKKPYPCNAYQPFFSTNLYHIPLPKRFVKDKEKTLTAKRYKVSKSKVKAAPPTAKVISRNRGNDLIVIDPGHGGHDTGAIAGRKREKDLVLQISKKLEKQLKKRGYKVYMTRRSDRFLKLPQRTKIADQRDAKVFVSIHANSVPKRSWNKVHGVETFFLQKTRDEKSQRIAARENKAVLKGAGSRLSKQVIIDSVLSGPKIVQSNKLAIDVQRRIITNLRSRYKWVKDGGVRHAPFWVLVGASRPSILIEVGYISHPRERKRLFSPRYQELIAKGIAEGIDNYLYNRKKEIDF